MIHNTRVKLTRVVVLFAFTVASNVIFPQNALAEETCTDGDDWRWTGVGSPHYGHSFSEDAPNDGWEWCGDTYDIRLAENEPPVHSFDTDYSLYEHGHHLCGTQGQPGQ